MSMFQSISCRLCINICNGHRSLYDDDGRRNEVYALTEKYFTPLLLNMDCVDQFAVICVECWRHISEFHTFQQSVLLAQKVSLANKRTEVVVKSELDEEEFISVKAKSMVNDVQRHHEVRSGEIATHAPQDLTNANTSTFSQDDSGAIVKSEVEEPLNDRGSASCSDDDAGQPSEVIVKSEYVVTEVSQDRAFSCEKQSGETDTPDKWEELDDSASVFAGVENDSLSECSDEELSLAECAAKTRRAKGGAGIGNMLGVDLMKAVFATEPPRAIQIQANQKRPQTCQEYDDFIAQWRPNLECVICRESYSSFSLLQQHFGDQHPVEQCHIVCCQLKFYQRHEIEKHIKFHINPNKCLVCCKCFATKSNLNMHVRMKHSGEPQESHPFKCSKCSKNYPRKGLLKTHLQYCCGTETSSKLTSTLDSRGHACEECGEVYKTVKLLQIHRKTHLASITLKCSICDMVYKDHRSFLYHMAKHEGKSMHTCAFCPMKFLRRASFYSHLNSQHRTEWYEQKKAKANKKTTYKCTACDRVYNTPVQLREHMAIHTGKNMYTCQFCQKAFTYRSTVYAHLKKLHCKEWAEKKKEKAELKKKLYKCAFCANTYETFRALREHQPSH